MSNKKTNSENKGWEAMNALLDREMPVRKKRRRIAFWWLPVGATGALAFVFGWFFLGNEPQPALVQNGNLPSIETERNASLPNETLIAEPKSEKTASTPEIEKAKNTKTPSTPKSVPVPNPNTGKTPQFIADDNALIPSLQSRQTTVLDAPIAVLSPLKQRDFEAVRATELLPILVPEPLAVETSNPSITASVFSPLTLSFWEAQLSTAWSPQDVPPMTQLSISRKVHHGNWTFGGGVSIQQMGRLSLSTDEKNDAFFNTDQMDNSGIGSHNVDPNAGANAELSANLITPPVQWSLGAHASIAYRFSNKWSVATTGGPTCLLTNRYRRTDPINNTSASFSPNIDRLGWQGAVSLGYDWTPSWGLMLRGQYFPVNNGVKNQQKAFIGLGISHRWQ